MFAAVSEPIAEDFAPEANKEWYHPLLKSKDQGASDQRQSETDHYRLG